MTVMNFGSVIASGDPDAVHRDPAVREAYLGEPAIEEAH
jgi:ABC-type branched-subunit amino acid transport system ATPase component